MTRLNDNDNRENHGPDEEHDEFNPQTDNLPPGGGGGWGLLGLQWVHGDENANPADWRNVGGFFSEERIPVEAAPPDEIQPVTMTTANGTAIKGTHARRLRLNVIRIRSCWFVVDPRDRTFRFSTYQQAQDFNAGAPRSHVQVAVRLPGSADLWCLTLKGHAANPFMLGNREDAQTIPELVRDYLTIPSQQAIRAKSPGKVGVKGLPLASWWITIGAMMHPPKDDSTTIWTPERHTVGSGKKKKKITPIFLLDPTEAIPAGLLNRHFVGNEIQRANADAWHELTPWVDEWRHLGRE